MADTNFDSIVVNAGGLKPGGVAITATSAEINAMAGQGVVAADMAKLHAVTASAAEINAIAAGRAGMSADGLGSLGVARVTFDASIAGNQSIAAHASTVLIPANAIVVGGFFDVNTVFHSAGADAGTIAISVEGANDIQTAAAVSGAPYSTINRKAIVPKANTPESTGVKASVARAVTFTVAGQILSAGKLTLFLYYVVSVASA
jgi:hypothetical protein